jgi:hypothetical protein
LKDLKKAVKRNHITDMGKLLRDMEVAKKRIVENNLKNLPKQTLEISRPVEYNYKARRATRVEKLNFKIQSLKAEQQQLEKNLYQEEGFYNKIFGKMKLFKGSNMLRSVHEESKAGIRLSKVYDEIRQAESTLDQTRLTGTVTLMNGPALYQESNPVVLYRDQQLKELKNIEEEIKRNQNKVRNAARLNVPKKFLEEKLALANKLVESIEILKIEKEEEARSLQYLKKEHKYIEAELRANAKDEFKKTYLKKKDQYYAKMQNITEDLKEKYRRKVSKFYRIVEEMSAAFHDMCSHPPKSRRRKPDMSNWNPHGK